MTKANVLKKFFKKFFNIDAEGNSSISVLTNVVQNNDSLPGGGGGGSSNIKVINVIQDLEVDPETGIPSILITYANPDDRITSSEAIELIDDGTIIMIYLHASDTMKEMMISESQSQSGGESAHFSMQTTCTIMYALHFIDNGQDICGLSINPSDTVPYSIIDENGNIIEYSFESH